MSRTPLLIALLLSSLFLSACNPFGDGPKTGAELIEEPAPQSILEERLEAVRNGPCIPWCIQTLSGGRQTPWFGETTPEQMQAMLLMDGDNDEARAYREAIVNALCPMPIPPPNNCGG